MREIKHIHETAIYAKDLDAAEKFYCDVLGLQVHSKTDGRHVFFRLAGAMFLVFNPVTTNKEERLPHGAHGPGHAAFLIESEDFDSWLDRLRRHDVEVELIKEWPRRGRSVYFRDPAGNSIELVAGDIWGL